MSSPPEKGFRNSICGASGKLPISGAKKFAAHAHHIPILAYGKVSNDKEANKMDGFFGNNSMLWIILLLYCCGGNNTCGCTNECGCGNQGGSCGCGGGFGSMLPLLLLCGCGGFGTGCGGGNCGCNR